MPRASKPLPENGIFRKCKLELGISREEARDGAGRPGRQGWRSGRTPNKTERRWKCKFLDRVYGHPAQASVNDQAGKCCGEKAWIAKRYTGNLSLQKTR